MIYFIALLGAAIVLFLASRNWRWSIKAALVVTVIEGGLRKWVLPQASELIYFLKDGILLGAYIGYFSRNNFPVYLFNRRPVFAGLVGGLTLIVGLQILNPLIGSPLVGLLGAKGYLFYLPLCLILPRLFGSVEELRTYLQWFLVLALPVGVLGVIQFFSPIDSWLNVYAPSEVEVDAAVFGEDGNVRVTGTFPYIAGYVVYITLCLALIFAVLVHLRSWSWRLLLVSLLGLLGVDLLMTGSRGAAVSAAGLFVGFVAFSIFEKSTRSRWLSGLLIPIGVGCFFVALFLFPSATEAFRSRATETEDSMTERIVFGMVEPVGYLDKGGAFGFGDGACQIACFALRDQLHLGPPPAYPPPVEGEPVRVLLEIGVLGFLLWYALRIYLLVTLWLVARRVRHPMLRHLALAAFLMHGLFITGQLVTNTTFSVFYWFLAGFAFLLPELDRRWFLERARTTRKRPPRLKEVAA